MQPASIQLLSLLLQNDSSFSHHERQVIKHLIDGSPLPVASLPDDKRLVPAEEVRRRIGCGKTHFYKLRQRHPELTPTDEFGPVLYRLDWVLGLIDRVGKDTLSNLRQEGGVACLSS